ncbi:glucuronyl hydrolase [Vallitalea longa]|uniref:Glucuronyl hydrolase n=1 Tax=Vallitalea longa TaxID=2936439 RepID=A0A9W6DDI1_9FIRM|nr:glycoside hydrolase family 88 protein [Vallitalea longa]GKX28200.1 glucuronyl hydrolase [Vallitalea longa]
MSKKSMEQLKKLCIDKTLNNMNGIKTNLREYSSCKEGNYFEELTNEKHKNISLDLSHIFVWTPSFFTGMACLAYNETNKPMYLKWLNCFYDKYYHKIFDTPMNTMHDLGFLYSPYSVALYKLTGDVNQKKVAIKAAEELAKRFMVKGNYIRAWGRLDDKIPEYVSEELSKNHFFTESKGLAIIDSMMNIPLLYWATEVTGNSYFADIANAHAHMTLKYFIRDDYSVYHAYRFDEKTGEPIGGTNYCGYSDESYWARGAAWAIYGFAIAYRYTHKAEYIEAANKLANEFIENIKETIVPIWDFRLPENEKPNKDTSAAAVAACGFIEIAKLTDNGKMLIWADRIIEKLSEQEYLNEDINCPGMLKQSNGRDVYWICGDYFYMEAIYKRLNDIEIFW